MQVSKLFPQNDLFCLFRSCPCICPQVCHTDDGLFLFCIFASAGLFTLFPLFRSHKRLEKKDWLFGIAVGVPNFMSARFLLAALTELPAFVAYPTYSVGAIVVISLFSFLLFREKLSKLQLAGVGIILAALVLLNL